MEDEGIVPPKLWKEEVNKEKLQQLIDKIIKKYTNGTVAPKKGND